MALTGLRPGTAYRYRILATDPLLEKALKEPVAGQTKTLTPFALPSQAPCANDAFRTGPAADLSDCRAYELVSPLDKEGGDIKPLEEGSIELPAVLEQASVPGPSEPQRLAYGSYRAFGDAVSAPWTSQYLATRTATGWRSEDITPPRGRLNSIGNGSDTELKLLSPDLCRSWWLTLSALTFAPAAVAEQPDLYRRDEADCGSGEGSWEAFTTLAPPHSNYGLELQGAAQDGSAIVYAVNDSLATEAPGPAPQPGACEAGLASPRSCVQELYYQQAGEGSPHYVCVLPNGSSIADSCSAGNARSANGQFRENTLRHALSVDGSQVFWSAEGKLYLRLNPGQPQSAVSGGHCTEAEMACTLAVSAQAEAGAGSSTSQYWTASSNGERAIFSTGGRLYEYDRASAEDHLIATGFTGLAGASEDATRLYFASSAVLAGANPQGEAPEANKPNLYLYDSNRPEGQRLAFVARILPSDVPSEFSPVRAEPAFNTSRVSPDGQAFAFMTQASPATAADPGGYDNTDAVKGKAAAEVYHYDATAAGGQGELLCASCNPTGARPVGENIERKDKQTRLYLAAAHIPGAENSLYANRALSTDGTRLYFESIDTLSPRDSNGASDVYQWQAPGAGSCKEGDPDYFVSNGGCIDLISSGQSPSRSHFLDADPSGHDVFFSTTQSLDPQDPGLADVYDAREGGGFPAPAPQAGACEGEACQGPYAPPTDPTPGSASFHGAGNVTGPVAKKKHKAKKKKHAAKHRRHRAGRRAQR